MQNRTLSPEAIAHRGVRDRYPENSLPAFVAAADAGAEAVELDVQVTADDILVVHHDANLTPRTSSPLAGRTIRALTVEELSDFELSPGIGIPTLADVLRAVTPSINVYIEIKAQNIEALLAELIASVPAAAGKCAVHSFDHRIARDFALLAPNVPTGILLVGYLIDPLSVLETSESRDLWVSCEFVDRELIETVHSGGGRVIAWTSNDPAEWDRLSASGVDGICTDRVAALVAHLRGD